MGKAICMLELSSIARGIETSDYMIKAAQVSLLRSSTVCPGKYMIIVGGDTGAVRDSRALRHRPGRRICGRLPADSQCA